MSGLLKTRKIKMNGFNELKTIGKGMMGYEQLKVFGVQTLGFLSAFTTVDLVLKMMLVTASLAYTIAKTIAVIKNEIRGKKDKEDGV